MFLLFLKNLRNVVESVRQTWKALNIKDGIRKIMPNIHVRIFVTIPQQLKLILI